MNNPIVNLINYYISTNNPYGISSWNCWIYMKHDGIHRDNSFEDLWETMIQTRDSLLGYDFGRYHGSHGRTMTWLTWTTDFDGWYCGSAPVTEIFCVDMNAYLLFTLWLISIAIEHDHLQWIYMDLPIKNGDFP